MEKVGSPLCIGITMCQTWEDSEWWESRSSHLETGRSNIKAQARDEGILVVHVCDREEQTHSFYGSINSFVNAEFSWPKQLVRLHLLILYIGNRISRIWIWGDIFRTKQNAAWSVKNLSIISLFSIKVSRATRHWTDLEYFAQLFIQVNMYASTVVTAS